MARIDLAYFQYKNGGLQNATPRGGGHGYDYTGLVRVMGEDDRWPDLIVMGAGNKYEYEGGDGMWGAVAAMRDAGGRAYTPLPCSLPREWGAFAPVIFVDQQTVTIKNFYSHHAPDFAARNRNLLWLEPASGGDPLYVVTGHGDYNNPAMALSDARTLRWLAYPPVLSVVLANLNQTLSGPHYEPTNLESWDLSRIWHKLAVGTDGEPVTPYRFDTSAPDFLCGHWDYDENRRVGGVGFHSVAEIVGNYTGTQVRATPNAFSKQISHILVNRMAGERVDPDSVSIHEPIDPDRPDSDSKRVSVTLEL